MNCSLLAEAAQWSCTPVGQHTLRASAPVTMGRDGQHVAFYVLEDSPGHFYLTDAHATIEHAIDHGARPTVARLQKIANTPGATHARLTNDGEIVADGSASHLGYALWDALRLAVAISGNHDDWAPRSQQERFASQVAKTLRAQLPPGSVVTKPRLTGISGRAIEFPLGVLTPDRGGIYAIQPIGTSEDHRVDWGHVYQSLGKLTDLKRASAKDFPNRVVIMESGASQEEFGRATTVLSEAARILVYDTSTNLAEQLLAA